MFNYKKLGFKAGLEVHFQLDTHKLFCSCPSIVNDSHTPDIKIVRKLASSESELGKKDIAVVYEQKKEKIFIYEACSTSSCLVEYDESPPQPINQKALMIALQVSKMINATIVDEVHIMRKLILDGSLTSGFQRSGLIARNGYIGTSKGKVKIPTLYLEEEAAKKISETPDTVIYRLDRLGIPLVEISTAPELQDPEHVKDTASLIGMIIQSTGSAKRGIGSVRQDINISLTGHPRIELKGFQDLRSIPRVIENEIQRQLETKNGESHVRKVEPDFTTSFLRPLPGAHRLYPETDLPIIKITKKFLDSIEIPELISERAINVEKKYKIPLPHAREIVRENIPFDYYAEKYCIDPKIIAHTLIEIPKELKSRFNRKNTPTQKDFEYVFSHLEKKTIHKGALIEILKDLIDGKKLHLEKYQSVTLAELDEFIKELVHKNPGVSLNGLMGDIMKQFKGSVDGSLALKLLKKYYKQ